MAIGSSAAADARNSQTIGTEASATSSATGGIAIGWKANVAGVNGITLGVQAQSGSVSVAIGYRANSGGNSGIAIGAVATVDPTAHYALALGYSSKISGRNQNSIVIGRGATLSGNYTNSDVSYDFGAAENAIVFGYEAAVSVEDGGAAPAAEGAIAFGSGANITAGAVESEGIGSVTGAMAIGKGATVTAPTEAAEAGESADGAIAFGSGAAVSSTTNAAGAMALGSESSISGRNANGAIAIGSGAVVNGEDNDIMGADVSVEGAIAFGYNAEVTGTYMTKGAIAFGSGAAVSSTTDAAGAVAIGEKATIYGGTATGAIVLGSEAQINSNMGAAGAIAIGAGAKIQNGSMSGAIALGSNAQVTSVAGGSNAIAIGTDAAVSAAMGSKAIAFGTGAAVSSSTDGTGAMAIGTDAAVSAATGTNAIAFGTGAAVSSSTDGTGAMAIGNGAAVSAVTGTNAIAFGTGAAVTGEDVTGSIALGANSAAETANTLSIGNVFGETKLYRNVEGVDNIAVAGGIDFTDTHAADLEKGQIKGVTQINDITVNTAQISGLADAQLNDSSTEAVTGKQLFATNAEVDDLQTKTAGITRTGSTTKIESVNISGTTVSEVTKLNNITLTDNGSTATDLNGVGTVNGVTIGEGGVNGVAINSSDGKVVVGEVDLTALDKSNSELVGKVAEAETSISNLTDNVGTLSADVGKAKSDIGSLQTKDNELESSISTVSGKVTEAEGKISTLNSSVESLTGSVSQISTEVEQAKTDIVELNGKTEEIDYSAGTGTTVSGVTIQEGILTNVAGINGITFSGNNLEKVGTVNGVTIDHNGISGFVTGKIGTDADDEKAVTAKEVEDYVVGMVGTVTGGVDLSELEDKTAGLERDAETKTTTIETNTFISETGISTNSVTATSATIGAVEISDGALTNVAGINGITFSGNNLEKVGTVNGVTIDHNGISGFVTGKIGTDADDEKAVTAKEVEDYVVGMVGTGGVDLSELEEKTAGLERDAETKTTTIETNTFISESGISTNSVTATSATIGAVEIRDGALTNVAGINGITFSENNLEKVGTVNGVTIGEGGVNGVSISESGIIGFDSGDIAEGEESAVTAKAVRDYVNKVVTGGTVDISDLEEKTGGLERVENAVVYAEESGEKDYTTIIEGNTRISKAGIETKTVEAESAIIGSVSISGSQVTGVTELNGIGFTGTNLTNVGTINNVTLRKDNNGVYVGGINITEMREDVDDLMNGAAGNTGEGGSGSNSDTAANTAGIRHEGVYGKDGSTTIIEDNTSITKEGITVDGYINAGTIMVNNQNIDDRYAEKDDVYTKEQVYTQTQVDDRLGQKADADVVESIGNNVNRIDGSVTALVNKTAGISVEQGVTRVSGVSFDNGNISDVEKASVNSLFTNSINGIRIETNESNSNLTIGGLDLGNIANYGNTIEQIKQTYDDLLDQIQNNGGNITVDGLTNVGGIVRKNTENKGKEITVIEDNTEISAQGIKTNSINATVGSIGGVSFDIQGNITNAGTYNGAKISGSYFNGIDIGQLREDVDNLKTKVDFIEENGTGSSGNGSDTDNKNTAGIKRPEIGKTVIEDNTEITNEGIKTDNVTADSIKVGEGEASGTVIDENGINVGQDTVQIDKDGIAVGKDGGTVISAADGIITDKGLYVGSSKDDYSFGVDEDGNITNTTGSYGFSTDRNGAHFTEKNPKKYGTNGSFDETTIAGNVVQTGRVVTDELVVNGNVIEFDGTDVPKQDFIKNDLKFEEDDGTKYENHFGTSGMNGTTQTHTQTSADGKTEQSTSVNTSYDGMTVTGSKTTTDEDGNKTTVTETTTMTGGSISVNTNTTYTEKDEDGKETEKTATSNVTIGNGDVKLDRVDEEGNHSTMYVGQEIDGIKEGMQQMGQSINELSGEVDEVGALSAALAGLHPQPENANSRADFAMAMGSYDGEQALAVGGFYRPDRKTMLSVGASTTSSRHMFNMGVSIALDAMPPEKREELQLKELAANNEALFKVLERLEKLEADNKAMALRYEKLSADYNELKEKYQIRDITAEEMRMNAEAAVKNQQTAAVKKAEPGKKIVVIEKDQAKKAKAEKVEGKQNNKK